MLMELREHPSTLDALRQLVEGFDVPKGFRVEILGGSIVLSPRGSSVHSRTILELVHQLDDQLPEDELTTLSDVETSSPYDDDNSPVPDLIVVPVQAVADDLAVLSADDVELAVEVVSRSNWSTDYNEKVELYARWSIPLYLMVDPRSGTVLLHSLPDPAKGVYRVTQTEEYGAKVALPEPLQDVVIDTADFLRYKPR